MRVASTFLFCLTLASLAGAVTLDAGVGQTYTDLDAAVTAANALAGHDDIVLHDASYEITSSPLIVTEAATLKTVGQAVTISKAVGTGGQVIRVNTGTGVFRVEGASQANPITLLQNRADAPNINSGPTTTNGNSVELENVVLEKVLTGSGSGGAFINFNNIGTGHSLVNVVLTGGDPLSTSAAAIFGNPLTANPVVSLTNVDFSGALQNGPRLQTSGGIVLTAANCDFHRDGGDVVNINQNGVPLPGSTLTFTDCTFQSGTFSVLETASGAADYVFIRPTVGPSGTSTNTFATLGASGSTVTVQGIYTLVNDSLTDTDSDGMSDLWEVVGQLDPTSSASPDGPGDDPDSDFATNIDEFNAGTNPMDPTDGPELPVGDFAGLALLMAILAVAGVAGQATHRRTA